MIETIRTLIVDDEPPARRKLKRWLDADPRFEVVAEAGDGEQAVAEIRRQDPDLVFLDVQMPRLDGFGVVRSIGVDAMPLTVFVTAYDHHALAAFEAHAIDYLLKPFAQRRFSDLLERVLRRSEADRASLRAGRLEKLLTLMESSEAGETDSPWKRILVRSGPDREILLPVEDVMLLRADGNYVRISTRESQYSRRDTLGGLMSRLETGEFLRINRSEAVRLDAVKEFQPWFHGDYRVVLVDGSVLTWSRRYRAKAPEALRRI